MKVYIEKENGKTTATITMSEAEAQSPNAVNVVKRVQKGIADRQPITLGIRRVAHVTARGAKAAGRGVKIGGLKVAGAAKWSGKKVASVFTRKPKMAEVEPVVAATEAVG